MPFNVATIKDKAISAKNATVSKVQNVRDKHSSTPMKNTRFAEQGYLPKAPPPPPPARSSFNSSRSSLERHGSEDGQGQGYGPPLVARGTKPGLSAERSTSTSPSPPPPPPSHGPSVLQRAKVFDAQPSLKPAPPPAPARASLTRRWSREPQTANAQDEAASSSVAVDRIDWANLSAEDKQMFFSWLDEFFERYIAKMRGVRLDAREQGEEQLAGNEVEIVVEPPPAPPVSNATVVPGRGPPPSIRLASKPTLDTTARWPPSQRPSDDFASSYPPTTIHGSQALDLAYYFHPSTSWSTPWYASQGAVPPPLEASKHRLYKAQMVGSGDSRSLTFAVLYCDLSAAWASVSYSCSTNRVMERNAKYLQPPGPMQGDELRRESERYGETIASFAESFLGSGQFCARGECWDLAAEALKFISENSDVSVPKPVPSLGRTHGHLIFVGRSTRGRQDGRWRGGDDRVRRGDIVEWRSVRISRVGDPPGGFAILGDPEHTAVVTRDSIPFPASAVYDGAVMEPRQIRTMEVVEQSRNDPPEPVRRTYDLNKFEEGEVWIYRPVSMVSYLGFGELECEVPAHALSL